MAGCSVSTALAALLALSTANSHIFAHGAGVLRDGGVSTRGELTEEHLAQLLGEDTNAHTKLEQWLQDAVYLFRDRMKQPQPDLGMPVLDPFSFRSIDPVVMDNAAGHVQVNWYSVLAKDLSTLEVEDLSLYLVERTGVVNVSVKNLTADVSIEIAPGSWLSPLKIPFNDHLKISFSSPHIYVGTRTKITLRDTKLHVQSVNVQLDLGDWKFVISHEGEGTSSHNPGLDELLAALVRDMAPTMIEAWMPVLEKKITAVLDELMQKVQISDLIPHD